MASNLQLHVFMDPGLLLVTRNGMPPRPREDFSIVFTAVAGTCEHPGVMVLSPDPWESNMHHHIVNEKHRFPTTL